AGSRARLLARRHEGEVFKRHYRLSQSWANNLVGVWTVRARKYSTDSLSTRSQRKFLALRTLSSRRGVSGLSTARDRDSFPGRCTQGRSDVSHRECDRS